MVHTRMLAMGMEKIPIREITKDESKKLGNGLNIWRKEKGNQSWFKLYFCVTKKLKGSMTQEDEVYREGYMGRNCWE